MWMILRRLIPNALELAAANAHDRHPDFIMKLWITVHVQRAAYAHRPMTQSFVRGSSSEGSTSSRQAAPFSHHSIAVRPTHIDTSIGSFSHNGRGLES